MGTEGEKGEKVEKERGEREEKRKGELAPITRPLSISLQFPRRRRLKRIGKAKYGIGTKDTERGEHLILHLRRSIIIIRIVNH